MPLIRNDNLYDNIQYKRSTYYSFCYAKSKARRNNQEREKARHGTQCHASTYKYLCMKKCVIRTKEEIVSSYMNLLQFKQVVFRVDIELNSLCHSPPDCLDHFCFSSATPYHVYPDCILYGYDDTHTYITAVVIVIAQQGHKYGKKEVYGL